MKLSGILLFVFMFLILPFQIISQDSNKIKINGIAPLRLTKRNIMKD